MHSLISPPVVACSPPALRNSIITRPVDLAQARKIHHLLFLSPAHLTCPSVFSGRSLPHSCPCPYHRVWTGTLPSPLGVTALNWSPGLRQPVALKPSSVWQLMLLYHASHVSRLLQPPGSCQSDQRSKWIKGRSKSKAKDLLGWKALG